MVFLLQLFFLFLALSCSTFWAIWVCLEIFTLFISSYLILQSSVSKWVFNYFVIQTVGSILFLFGVMSNFFFFKLLLSHMGLFMKLGAFPFHSWTFSFIEKLNWKNIAVVFGFPKFIPVCGVAFISSVSFYWTFFLVLILCGSCIPGSNLKMTTMRSIISYSAVVHTSWILASCLLSKQVSLFYFFFYTWLLFPLCYVFYLNSVKSVKDLVFSKNLITTFFFANFTGIPPFLGFFLKYIVLLEFFKNMMYFEGGLLGLFSILPIYLYMKIFFFSILSSKYSKDYFLPQEMMIWVFIFPMLSILFLLMLLF